MTISCHKHYQEIGSTNDVAFEWAKNGAPDFAVVTADFQTDGRGRMKRKWLSQADSGLAMSIIIRPCAAELSCLALFSAAAGLAVAMVIEKIHALPIEIKWPNDILCRRMKICGILSEALWDGDELSALVVGIGMNILASAIPSEANLRYPAGCLEDFAVPVFSPLIYAEAIVTQLQIIRPLIGQTIFFQQWMQKLAFLEEAVRLFSADGKTSDGTFKGVDGCGNALVESDGKIICYTAGEISLRPIRQNNNEER